METTATHKQYGNLETFRQKVFSTFLKRRSAVINLCDALLERPKPRSITELSLSPLYSRRWSSLYDAVEEALFAKRDLERVLVSSACEDLFGRQFAPSGSCFVSVGDASVVRRSSSRSVAGLRYIHTQTHEVGGRGIVVGHQYQLLRYVAEPHTSWALPLMSDRLGISDTPQSLAASQLARLSTLLPEGVPSLGVFDGAFGCASFLVKTKEQDSAAVARTRKDKVFWHPPEPGSYTGRGCKPLYGEKFDCSESRTWGEADTALDFEQPRYGSVRLSYWGGLLMRPPKNEPSRKHRRQTPLSVGLLRSAIRCGKRNEAVVWLIVQLNGLPDEYASDVKFLWESWGARAGIEASIKVSKQDLSWAMPQTATPEAADRWTAVTDIALWHLFLAREIVARETFAWWKQEPPPTPRRVRQGIADILSRVASLAEAPRLRGKSPGWTKGRKRKKPERQAAIYKGKKHAIRAG